MDWINAVPRHWGGFHHVGTECLPAHRARL